jgi:hypothetical protein
VVAIRCTPSYWPDQALAGDPLYDCFYDQLAIPNQVALGRARTLLFRFLPIRCMRRLVEHAHDESIECILYRCVVLASLIVSLTSAAPVQNLTVGAGSSFNVDLILCTGFSLFVASSCRGCNLVYSKLLARPGQARGDFLYDGFYNPQADSDPGDLQPWQNFAVLVLPIRRMRRLVVFCTQN